MRVSRISICIPFAAALMTGASAYGALANDELIQLVIRRQELGNADGRLRQHPLFEAQPDQQGQCEEPAGQVDVLHWRAARP